MVRRWVGSSDVVTDETGAILFSDSGCESIAGGSKTVASVATPEPLMAVSTPCRFVWVGALVDGDGVAQNTKPCFIGDANGQNIPIMLSNYEGLVISINDAAKVFVKVGVNGEGVAYRIFA